MHRVRKIIADAQYQDYLARTAEAEKERIYCKHDYQHALYVARISCLIALESRRFELKPLVYAAGLLHDIGRWVEYATGEDHCQAASPLAEPLLFRAGFSREETDVIIEGIVQHRSPQGSKIGEWLARADDLSRDCYGCQGRPSCYKAQQMLRLHRSLEL